MQIKCRHCLRDVTRQNTHRCIKTPGLKKGESSVLFIPKENCITCGKTFLFFITKRCPTCNTKSHEIKGFSSVYIKNNISNYDTLKDHFIHVSKIRPDHIKYDSEFIKRRNERLRRIRERIKINKEIIKNAN